MSSFRRHVLVCVAILSLIALGALALRPIAPSIVQGSKLRGLLSSAARVTAFEYSLIRADSSYADLLTERDLTSQQISGISSAFRPIGVLRSHKACSFEPHHKLVCTMKDGSRHDIHICFQCGDIRVDSGGIFDMSLWESTLRKALLDAGIPVRPEKYRIESVPSHGGGKMRRTP